MTQDLRQQLKAVHAYAVTPFRADDLLSVDWEGFAGNLRFLVDQGVRVINVGGGTGEIDALSAEELGRLAEVALETAGDAALVTPTLPGNSAAAVELAHRYQAAGARVCLAMPPFERNRVPDDLTGVLNHLRLISERVPGLWLLPYNTQGWSVEFFERLASIDAVIGVKDPCVDDHPLFRAIQRLGDRFVWIGNKRHDPGSSTCATRRGSRGSRRASSTSCPGRNWSLSGWPGSGSGGGWSRSSAGWRRWRGCGTATGRR